MKATLSSGYHLEKVRCWPVSFGLPTVSFVISDVYSLSSAKVCACQKSPQNPDSTSIKFWCKFMKRCRRSCLGATVLVAGIPHSTGHRPCAHPRVAASTSLSIASIAASTTRKLRAGRSVNRSAGAPCSHGSYGSYCSTRGHARV